MAPTDLDAARAKVAELVKLDLLSKNAADENAAKRKEIARTFICTRSPAVLHARITHFIPSGHNHRSSSPPSNNLVARTETRTVPTVEMYEYATQCTLGDDVYFEPSTS